MKNLFRLSHIFFGGCSKNLNTAKPAEVEIFSAAAASRQKFSAMAAMAAA
jgi:hypothetical protein